MVDLSTIKIMKRLKKENPQLHQYVIARCEDAMPLIDSISETFREYTDHSSKHSYEVLILGDALLCKAKLNQWEIAVFALACFYHDSGMYCTKKEYNTLSKNEDFQREYAYLKETVASENQLKTAKSDIVEKFIRVEYIRKNHGERGRKWILNKFPKDKEDSFFEGIYLWDVVSDLCVGHCLNEYDINEGYSSNHGIGSAICIDLRFLLCLLRLADICHLSRNRALPYMRKNINFYSQKSLNIWKKHSEIAGTHCDAKHGSIRITATPDNFHTHSAIMGCAADIECELQLAHQRLAASGSNYSFLWKFVDTSNIKAKPDANYNYVNARFALDYYKITELLMGSKLYRDPLFAIRECVQNSLDAIQTYRLKDAKTSSYIVIAYKNDKEHAFLDIFDNGTGMDQAICVKYLLSVGSKSFYTSEKRYKDWGTGSLSVIASHGIGFLATFMLADLVEVYSIYPSQKPVHLRIHSLTSTVEFLKTDNGKFPVIASHTFDKALPWDQGHGTCIRLRLKNRLTSRALLEFLARNIIRTRVQPTVVYEDKVVNLPEIWHEAGWVKANVTDLKELRNTLISTPKENFYENPPRDTGLKSDIISKDSVKFRVQLAYDHVENSRISQDGILVTDGDDYLTSLIGTPNLGEHGILREQVPFSYDIDVTGKYCFELDAERCRIIDSPDSRRIGREIGQELWQAVAECISKIESSLYFRNGAKYYHGGGDLLAPDYEKRVYFHKPLTEWFTPSRIREFDRKHGMNPLLEAKIYNLCSEPHNRPVSAKDIIEESLLILIPLLPDYGVPQPEQDNLRREDIMDNMNRWVQKNIFAHVKKHMPLDRIVYLPGFPNCFSLILSVVCDFEFENINDFALIATPRLRSKYSFKTDDLLQKMYRQHIKQTEKKNIGRYINEDLLE